MPYRSRRPPADTSSIRSLNLPRSVAVEADGKRLPRAINAHGWRRVEAILDVWRVDDEWWQERISRRYFLVMLEGGVVRTVFHDLVRDEWYQQSY